MDNDFAQLELWFNEFNAQQHADERAEVEAWESYWRGLPDSEPGPIDPIGRAYLGDCE